MARKASDLMSLLAQRGSLRRRSRGGWVQQFGSVLRAAIAGRPDATSHRSAGNRAATASLGVVAAAIVCVGVGYVLGNTFPWAQANGTGGLRASTGDPAAAGGNHGIAPGPIGEKEDLRPLNERFFVTSAYESMDAASAAARALRQAGLASARLRQVPLEDKIINLLVVYFDGDRARDATRSTLMTTAAPDDVFEQYRKTQKGWPLEQGLR